MPESSQSSGERRISVRRVPQRTTKAQALKGTNGLGSNLAVGLLDLSTTGARFLSRQKLAAGAEVEITFNGLRHLKPLKRVAVVRWCSDDAEGRFHVGAEFDRTLDHHEMMQLARIG